LVRPIGHPDLSKLKATGSIINIPKVEGTGKPFFALAGSIREINRSILLIKANIIMIPGRIKAISVLNNYTNRFTSAICGRVIPVTSLYIARVSTLLPVIIGIGREWKVNRFLGKPLIIPDRIKRIRSS